MSPSFHPSTPHISLLPSFSLSPGSKQDKGFICQVECVTQASALKQSTGNGERQRRRNTEGEYKRDVYCKECSDTTGLKQHLRCDSLRKKKQTIRCPLLHPRWHTHLSHIFPSVTELSTDTQQNLRLIFQITALFCITVSLYSFTIGPMNKWVMCAIISNKYDSPYDSFHLMSPANTHFSKCCRFPYMEIFLPPQLTLKKKKMWIHF